MQRAIRAHRVFSWVSNACLQRRLQTNCRCYTRRQQVDDSDLRPAPYSIMATALLAQSFAGNPLQRSFDLERKTSRFTADILSQPENVELLLTKGRSLCVCQRNQQQNSIAWFQLSELSDHGVITHGGFLSMGGGKRRACFHIVS